MILSSQKQVKHASKLISVTDFIHNYMCKVLIQSQYEKGFYPSLREEEEEENKNKNEKTKNKKKLTDECCVKGTGDAALTPTVVRSGVELLAADMVRQEARFKLWFSACRWRSCA